MRNINHKNEGPKEKKKVGKKQIVIGICLLAFAIIAALIFLNLFKDKENENVVYRSTNVEKGNLTVGVDVEGTILVGTSTQTLDLDISAYTGSEEFSFGNMNNMSAGNGPGGNSGGPSSGMPGGMPGSNMGSPNAGNTITGGSSSTSSSSRTLLVEALYVSVGQEIKKGDPVVKLSQSSVDEIRKSLEEDVTSAEVTYNQQVTESKLSDISNEQTLETNMNNGSYAYIVYEQTLEGLQNDVDDAQKNLDEANEKLTELNEDLAEYESKISEYKEVLTNAEYTVKNIDVRESVYGWTTAENARESAQSMYDNLMDNIDTAKEDIEETKTKIISYESALATAVSAQKTGTIEAKATYDKEMLNNANMDELYEVTKSKTALSTEIAYDDYVKAKEKLDEFNESITGQTILAKSDGVVTDVIVNPGDYIGTGSEIITVNDYDEVTVTVDVEESNIDSAQAGSVVNVYVQALPDATYTGVVSEVGDATYDSSTSKTYYEVTVTLAGNTSALFSGMNVKLTFLTKEIKEVTYVSNRAIIREDGKSYVKVRDENGRIKNINVETGFSDGINVEVVSGLEVQDTVLIESKVNE